MIVKKHVLGIDIGSVSAGLVVISPEKHIIQSGYRFHNGNIADTLRQMLAPVDLPAIGAVAATSSTPPVINARFRYDDQVALIAAARERHPEAGAILSVGGEKFGLILFDENGHYRKYLSNTSCAAGTGSFLDQQAGRLNLAGIEDLCARALGNTGGIPRIASRCAVFAKTDLIHAQQEGYSLESICDGLCHGLARNIVDTLFTNEHPRPPMVLCGGVSHNRPVAGHIGTLTGVDIIADQWSHLYGAYGAALHCLAGIKAASDSVRLLHPDDIISSSAVERSYAYRPLELTLSQYPDFESHEQYVFSPERDGAPGTVEVDVYAPASAATTWTPFLGVDIGSTSTKAVLMGEAGDVLAGFYTRTAGRPVDAIQSVLAAVEDLGRRKGVTIAVRGAGTTGSGRKFVGRVLGADLILDEITAHARAAVALNPAVDTIIEIGGQDAKFTTLKDGRVTFSAMNTVCAAGTGSFIEEQARRLQCPLDEFPARTKGCRSPMTSDRCTVFMERDINHFLSVGYAREEMLAASLHAVRENYLAKVATPSQIGSTVLFQGATAKNRALVAAFEQGLNQPIHVSRYCHLTGALGTALTLAETAREQDGFVSQFRGIELYRAQIPIRNEICDLCANHCKITVAVVGTETVAYGFLCGRDYETRRFVGNNTSGFDLMSARRDILKPPPSDAPSRSVTIGLPAALQLVDDLSFWTHFFAQLGIRTIVSDRFAEGVKTGKRLTGAEFCAPVAALHGHVRHLLDRADYVFVPTYFENRDKEKHTRRQYCYYTQYAPALVADLEPSRVLTPLVNYLYSHFHTKRELYRMLKSVCAEPVGFMEVNTAYENALALRGAGRDRLRDSYRRHRQDSSGDIRVVLLGRPYTVLSREMNKHIPDIFSALGIKVFYQDMLDPATADLETVKPLLDEIHWEHAAEILKSAVVAAQTESLYPVLLTSFMCTPDSFVMDYFRRVMDLHGKPYLILQIDEHGSSVGYETRIEAAVRAFRNHNSSVVPPVPRASCRCLQPAHASRLEGKTVLMPNWDDITCRLLVAAMQRDGYDARLLEETESSVRKSLRHNTGQCIPLNIIAQEFADYVGHHHLEPDRTVLWMAGGEIACNLKLYPYHIKRLVNDFGNGLEKAEVYSGDITLSDISPKMSLYAYFAFMFGGMLRKMACRLRPYEREAGATDRALAESVRIGVDAFLGRRDWEEAAAAATALFEAVDISEEPRRPQVAIFGDLYVRDNRFINQNLIRFIEQNGGEVITTPYSTYARMIAGPYFRKWFREGKYWHTFSSRALMSSVQWMERRYYRHFERVLREPEHAFRDDPGKILAGYHLGIEHTGESMDNILKVHYIRKHFPDVALFVQTNPAFCCPSIVTQAMSRKIEENTGVPVVSITYDGTGSFKNSKIIPYLAYPRKTGQPWDRRIVSVR
ncbi:MAG: acyl-CoA dehydratase activase [Thermodesulfobacteriota bacterium]